MVYVYTNLYFLNCLFVFLYCGDLIINHNKITGRGTRDLENARQSSSLKKLYSLYSKLSTELRARKMLINTQKSKNKV